MDTEAMLAQEGQPVTDRRTVDRVLDALALRWNSEEREEVVQGILSAEPPLQGSGQILAWVRRRYTPPRNRNHHAFLAETAAQEARLVRGREQRARQGVAPCGPAHARPAGAQEDWPYRDRVPLLDRTTPIVSIGGCFSTALAHVLEGGRGRYLVTEPFRIPGVQSIHASAAWGNLFSAPAIRQIVEAATQEKTPPLLAWKRGGAADAPLVDPWRDEVIHADPASMSASWRAHGAAARAAFERAEVLVITLMQHEVWCLKGTDHVLARKPWGLDEGLFERRCLDVDEVVAELRRAIRGVRAVNPNCRFVVAASPLRQAVAEDATRHPLEVAAEGQAVHAAAIARLTRQDEGVTAFPMLTLSQTRGPLGFADDDRHVHRRLYAEAVDAFLHRHERRASDVAADLLGCGGGEQPLSWTAAGAMEGAELELELGTSGLGGGLERRAADAEAPVLVVCGADEIDLPAVRRARQAGACVATTGGPALEELKGALRDRIRMAVLFQELAERMGEDERGLSQELADAWGAFQVSGQASGRDLQLLQWLRDNPPLGGAQLLQTALQERFPLPAALVAPGAQTPPYSTAQPVGALESEILAEPTLAMVALHEAHRGSAARALGGDPQLLRIRLLDSESVRGGALDDGPWLQAKHLVLPRHGGPAIVLDEEASQWPAEPGVHLVLTAGLDAFGPRTPRHVCFGSGLSVELRKRISSGERWLGRWSDLAPWEDTHRTEDPS